MPRDFLCPCQPRFLGVSRGGILFRIFRVVEKQDLTQRNFIPELGSTFTGIGMIARVARRGAAFNASFRGTIHSVRRVFRPNRIVSRGSLERVPGLETYNLPWRGMVLRASRLFVHENVAPDLWSVTRHDAAHPMQRPPSGLRCCGSLRSLS